MVPRGRPGPSPLPGNTQGQVQGPAWPSAGSVDRPGPAPSLSTPSPADRKMTGLGTKTLAPTQSCGEPQDVAVRWGSLPRAAWAPHPQGRCLEDSGAWAAFTYCHLLPSCPGGHRQVSRRKKSGRSSSPVTAPPPGTHPPSLPAFLLPPLPGVQPGSRQPMETTSSAPVPGELAVCV